MRLIAEFLNLIVNKGWLLIKNLRNPVVNKSSLLAATKKFSNTLLIMKSFQIFFFICNDLGGRGGGYTYSDLHIYAVFTALKIHL